MTLRVGTRQSALAKAQTAWVIQQLQTLDPSLAVETVFISTSGDRAPSQQGQEIPLKGLFTKELDEALLDQRIDVAVHSFKDIPPGSLGPLHIITVPERERPNDAWIARDGTPFSALPLGSRVATNSARRRALLLRARPDLKIIPMRGNVDTRLQKLDGGAFDGLVLAYAGLKRLGFEKRVTDILPVDPFLPAAGQGALALVVRGADVKNKRGDFLALFQLDHKASHMAALCEQTCLEVLAGSCHTPIAVLAQMENSGFKIRGTVLHPDGIESFTGERVVPATFNPVLTGRLLAEELLALGAQRLLRL